MPLCTNITEDMVRVAIHLVPAQHHLNNSSFGASHEIGEMNKDLEVVVRILGTENQIIPVFFICLF